MLTSLLDDVYMNMHMYAISKYAYIVVCSVFFYFMGSYVCEDMSITRLFYSSKMCVCRYENVCRKSITRY